MNPKLQSLNLFRSSKNNFLTLCCVLMFAGSTGCFAKDDPSDRMKVLAERAQSAGPEAAAALDQLIGFSQSSNYWEHYYALAYIGQIATGDRKELRNRIMPSLIEALNIEDQAIQRMVVSIFRDVGSDAVDRVVPKLLHLVNTGEERDVTWFAAEALGKSKDSHKREQVLRALTLALDKEPPGLSPSAPQLRYYALSSLVELGVSEPQPILLELRKRAAITDPVFSKKIHRAIDALEKPQK